MLSAEQLDTFAAVFSVLARIQVQPASEQTLHDVRSMITEWPLAGANEPTAAGMLAILGSSSDKEIDVLRDQDELYGISAETKVAPFESVHRGIDRLVFDTETMEVRAAYRSMALQAPKMNREPDDHIGLEFDFIAQCCIHALTAIEQGADAAAARYLGVAFAFTRDHLLKWAPDMLQDAVDQCETSWVRGMELLSIGALQAWVDAIADLTESGTMEIPFEDSTDASAAPEAAE